MRSKVLGMLIGGAVGDALGMPVETWTPKQIENTHGRVKNYCNPIDHKWFTADPQCSSKTFMVAGSTTDDTQLTLATLNGIIQGHDLSVESRCFSPYLDEIAKAHVLAMQKSISGWGKSTVEAVERLNEGLNWRESGKTDNLHRGTGNGVPMKCSPLAVLMLLRDLKLWGDNFRFFQEVVNYSAITHYTQMAAESGVIHCSALYYALQTRPQNFNHAKFAKTFLDVYRFKQNDTAGNFSWDASHLVATEDSLEERITSYMEKLSKSKTPERNTSIIYELYGQGSCYVYDSLPVSYAMFLRDPWSFESVIDTVNAGGDTDTNAKIVGELFGALHGIEFFENAKNRWMIDELQGANEIIQLGETFCDTLNIN